MIFVSEVNYFYLQNEGNFASVCSGSPIGRRYILAAAHCKFGRIKITYGKSKCQLMIMCSILIYVYKYSLHLFMIGLENDSPTLIIKQVNLTWTSSSSVNKHFNTLMGVLIFHSCSRIIRIRVLFQVLPVIVVVPLNTINQLQH